jgi:hypothetical protein
MKCVVTQTDTFGGEANYGWVNRYEFLPKNPESQRSIVRRAKELAGLTGVRCETENWGDSLTLKPRGYAQVVFVDFE